MTSFHYLWRSLGPLTYLVHKGGRKTATFLVEQYENTAYYGHNVTIKPPYVEPGSILGNVMKKSPGSVMILIAAAVGDR